MKIKLLHFLYSGYSGGKFIINCLGHSRAVAPQDSSKCIEVCNNQVSDSELSNFFVRSVPTDRYSNWSKHEYGCIQLFGKGISEIKTTGKLITSQLDMSVMHAAANNNIWLPIVTHSVGEFNNVNTYFKSLDSEIFSVGLRPCEKFYKLAQNLKLNNADSEEINNATSPHPQFSNININYLINNWNPLLENNLSYIIDLANKLKINFDITQSANYINTYIKYHTT